MIGTPSFFSFFLEEKGGLHRFLYFPDPAQGRCYSISGFDINFETIFIKDYSLDFASHGTECGLLFVKLGYMRTVGEYTGVGTEKIV